MKNSKVERKRKFELEVGRKFQCKKWLGTLKTKDWWKSYIGKLRTYWTWFWETSILHIGTISTENRFTLEKNKWRNFNEIHWEHEHIEHESM